MLEKTKTLYERDEKGELIPIEVEVEIEDDDEKQLEYKGEKILLIPMPRGEVRKMFATMLAKDNPEDDKDVDGEIILKHCVSPSYSKEEIPHIKPTLSKILVNTVLRESGVKYSKNGKVAAMRQKEDEFGKN